MSEQSTRPLIVIGICTRQRNALLRRLLESIWSQPEPADYDIDIVIIDNNDTPHVTSVIDNLPQKFTITVFHESRAGLVHARNRILDAATEWKADWIIGVDDDEWVAEDWLAQFIAGLEILNAHVIVGTSHFIYEGLTPYLPPIQQVPLIAGRQSAVLSTANFALHKTVFDPAHGPGLRFDMRFNESGGEDYEFMLRAERAYDFPPIGWPFAITYEGWEGKRATLRYRMTRYQREQNARFQVAALHRRQGLHGSWLGNLIRQVLQINRLLVFGVGYVLAGYLSFALGRPRAREKIGVGMLKLARVAAVAPYLWGTTLVGYGANAPKDR